MHGWGRAQRAARLLGAAATSLALAAPLLAQGQGAVLDPSAPLDAMPDIGVAWPELDDAPEPTPIEGERPAAPVATADAAAELRYAVTIEGLDEIGAREDLAKAFEQASALRKGKQSGNAAQIERRSAADTELLLELLRSRGYYDATVEPLIDRTDEGLRIRLAAAPGPQYLFQSVELPGLAAAGPEAETLGKAFAVKAGDPVVAEDVIAGGIALKVALGEEGFALAEIGDQQVEVDHETHTATLVLPVQPGPLAAFGAIRVSGRPPFGVRHVGQIARFRTGDPFRRSEVDDLRRALIATGLVAAVEVKVVPAADPRTVDLDVHLEPAPMRTMAGELGYGSGEGVHLEASWQHRNFVNPEGALTLRGVAGTKEQLAAVSLRRGNFRRRDQVLNLQASASHRDLSAYEAKTVQLLAGIERQSNIIWRKKWTWSVGTELIGTDERGIFDDPLDKQTRKFFIAALPASLYYDGSNDLLDPTRGFRLGGRLSPEASIRGGAFGYTRAQIDASAYHPVADNVVAAARVRIGSIIGAKSSSIAPSRRFYAGGGGSVRGYNYQELGPQDAEGDPIGGRGLAEFALEARFRRGVFGIVPFIDGGTLTGKQWPDFGKWKLGAGIGVRYYSSFGPIRVDVGTPLNNRKDHAPVAVAVSLGQAF